MGDSGGPDRAARTRLQRAAGHMGATPVPWNAGPHQEE